MEFKEVFQANKGTIIKNHNEWYKLVTSKKLKDIEVLESYRGEFAPFKAEDSQTYATITIDRMISNSKVNIDLMARNKYISELLKSFKKKID